MRLAFKQVALALGFVAIVAGTPAIAAAKAPAAQHETQAEHDRGPRASNERSSDEAAYAAREAKNPELARFAAGDAIVISSTVVAAALVIVLLALLL